ncbi:MAG: hypothetical protein M3253_07755, partial [Chloroflexota bacterium]|nr:hypothetical protein [Chloroflexota bacterium]
MSGTGPPGDGPRDPSRRQFFRHAATELGRGGAAAGELLKLGIGGPVALAARLEQQLAAVVSPADMADLARQGISRGEQPTGFRSPYLFTGDSLVIFDQRLPYERSAMITCRQPSEVAAALASG